MILIDTSAWIDFFNGHDLAHVTKLERFIRQDRNLALCSIVLTEILQGIAEDRTHRRVRRYLRSLVMLPMPASVFLHAADIYRSLRGLGITIRKTNDCMIAATALHHRCELLHNDRDLRIIGGHFPLKVA